jgi:hypothetical protein
MAVAEKLTVRLVDKATTQADRESLHMAAGLVLGWYGKGVADVEPALIETWHAFSHGDPFWHG